MNKFWAVILITFYLIIGCALYLITPYLIGQFIYDITKPKGFIMFIIGVMVWFFFVNLLTVLTKALRKRFGFFDRHFKIIEDINIIKDVFEL
jgi:hypothetical protein